MNILNNINNIQKSSGLQISEEKKPNIQVKSDSDNYKPDILDFLSEKVVNKNDLNDMVTTPRAIFKGYLCFTAGTMLSTIAGFIKKEKISNPIKIIGVIISILGTYNFVKPYLIRNDKLTNTQK